MKHPTTNQRWFATVPALILITAAAGCGSILDTTEDLADNANIFVTGTSPVPLQLIVSSDYTAIENSEGRFDVTLIRADTIQVGLPYERREPISERARIFVRLTQPDSTVTADVRLRILLDDREVYNVQATLRDASLEYLFAYY
jgi:hypothetical protein